MLNLVKKEVKSPQGPKQSGITEFSRHFLRPKDMRRFSTVTRATIVATDLVKDYVKMNANLKVGFELAKSNVVKAIKRRSLSGFKTRIDLTPTIEIDNDE